MRVVGVAVVLVIASSAAAAPRAPGVYPLLVVHGTEKPHAYVLGCARVTKDGNAVLLGPRQCSALLRKRMTLDLVGDAGRTTVKIMGSGTGDTCPEVNAKEPYVVLSGLPEERNPGGFVVAPGVADVQPDQKVIDAIAAKHPPGPGKKVMRPGTVPSLGVVGAFDLDGDGTPEVIVESLGRYQLFRADGRLIGTVGCEYG